MAVDQRQKNLNQYLTDVVNFIDIPENEYKKTKRIFDCLMDQVKKNMDDQCKYFKSFSTEIKYAGSVSDKLKISKLDEFDMDIVIRLPVNYDKIEIIDYAPGYVQLKIEELKFLSNQKHWENQNKVTRLWYDEEYFLLQNTFRQWIHSIVERALKIMNEEVIINNVTYKVKYRHTGPAYTLNVENVEGNPKFNLDVDLVPVIKFMHPIWPSLSYRRVTEAVDWLAVPKPNKEFHDEAVKNRCWRLSFQDHERRMMKDCGFLRPTIKLMKKLRDTLKMKPIASYYIKTIFLWKLHKIEDKKKFWQKPISETFRIMVQELYNAVKNRNISYFWNEELNLIANVNKTILNSYARDLAKLLVSIDCNNVDKILLYLLNTKELQEFQKSEHYEKRLRNSQHGSAASLTSALETPTLPMRRLETAGSLTSSSACSKFQNPIDKVVELLQYMDGKIDALRSQRSTNQGDDSTDRGAVEPLQSINSNMDLINENLEDQKERLKTLELGMGIKDDHKTNILYDDLDVVEELGARLKNLETAVNYKEKFYEAADAIGEALEIDKVNRPDKIHHTQKSQQAGCSTNQVKVRKDGNYTVLEKIIEYNERLKKLEESNKKYKKKFDEFGIEMGKALGIDDSSTKKRNKNDPVPGVRDERYLNSRKKDKKKVTLLGVQDNRNLSGTRSSDEDTIPDISSDEEDELSGLRYVKAVVEAERVRRLREAELDEREIKKNESVIRGAYDRKQTSSGIRGARDHEQQSSGIRRARDFEQKSSGIRGAYDHKQKSSGIRNTDDRKQKFEQKYRIQSTDEDTSSDISSDDIRDADDRNQKFCGIHGGYDHEQKSSGIRGAHCHNQKSSRIRNTDDRRQTFCGIRDARDEDTSSDIYSDYNSAINRVQHQINNSQTDITDVDIDTFLGDLSKFRKNILKPTFRTKP